MGSHSLPLFRFLSASIHPLIHPSAASKPPLPAATTGENDLTEKGICQWENPHHVQAYVPDIPVHRYILHTKYTQLVVFRIWTQVYVKLSSAQILEISEICLLYHTYIMTSIAAL